MKLFAALVFLLYAFQKSLTVTVEVQEGSESVLLPCQYSKVLEEVVTVKWTRFDLNPKTVHQRKLADELQTQNPIFRERTSMDPEALDSRDFSLTLREPKLLDSGVYICSMTDEKEETAVCGIQLHVKASQDSLTVTLDVYEGAKPVVLPCQNNQAFRENLSVKWSRFDLNPNTVHQRREGDDLQAQNVLFSGRTSMRSDAVESGNFSLILREPQLADSGVYICSIRHKTEEKMLSGVQMHVREKFPSWAIILLVLLILLLVSGGLLFHFRHYFISVYRVEVDSGVESVLLPFKTAVRLPERTRVTWRNSSGRMIYTCYGKSKDRRERDYRKYEYRSDMNNPGKFGDFSLILKNPTDRDTGTYTCTAYRFGKILTVKQVQLNVKGGADSLIVAIDVGSGYSGYAYNVKPREEGGETQLKRWSNGFGPETPKTPTCILFDEHEEFLKFGYEAKTAFINMRGRGAEKHYFFEDFKLAVRGINYWWERIKAANRKWLTILKVFTEVLRFLKDDALKTINTKTTGGKFTASDFIWVLTVPGNFYDFDFDKQFMIEAATQAGLVTEETRSKVKLVLESEAALAWCLKLPSDGFISQNHSRNSQDQPAGAADADTSCNDPPGSQEAVKFIKEPEETKVLLETQRDGKRYLVVDCGDEYIDTTVHEVMEGKAFKKLHYDYEYYGGRTVDEEFKEFLRKIFSKVWEEYETKFPNEVQKIMSDFRLKLMDEDVQISCPDNLVILAQKQKEIKTFFDLVEGASWDDGSIRISRDKLRSFFDESLEGITKSLREILNKDYNIGYIVLVGGFAESQILRQHIIDQFGHQYKVLCPLRPQEVILKGAVELGRNPKLVESQ